MPPAEGETPKYQCYEADKEDLTDKVKAAIALNKGKKVVFFGRLRSRKSSAATSTMDVMVTCSKGHKNVFRVRG